VIVDGLALSGKIGPRFRDMEIKRGITVDGLRGRWTTNMSDDDLREFWRQHCGRARAEEFDFSLPGACISLKIIAEALPFRDGMCLWHGVNERQTVIFHTMKEWEVFDARQREIREFRDEQEALSRLAAERSAKDRTCATEHRPKWRG
jgi:hypothetical protein